LLFGALMEAGLGGDIVASIGDIHVLVVDDNKQMRFLLRCLLRAGGITDVSEAECAHDAFAIMSGRPVDLIIVDWMMQPIDGLAFTRMVRWDAKSPNPYVPLLMLTAHTETSRVAAARDAGVSGFVKKPISARVLFDRMTSALTDTRMFIKTDSFMGPDRRRGVAADYAGPFRRDGDKQNASLDTIDLDDVRWRA
jgi:two-component system, chemotaxis family, chemotaxis protein CheY